LIQIWSPQETIDLAKTPLRRLHALGLDVDTSILPEACGCCFEDVNWQVQIIGTTGVTGHWVTDPETCTATLVLTFTCDPCDNSPGGGA